MAKVKEPAVTQEAQVPAVQQGGELATRTIATGIVPVRPEFVDVLEDFDPLEDTGLEGVTTEERRLPIIRILDSKSPQVAPLEAGGIKGAKAGDIFNTATGQVYDGTLGLYMVPCYRDRKFVRYYKRDEDGQGGGFAGIYEPEDPFVKQCQAARMEKFGNLFGKLDAGVDEDTGKDMELVETYYLYAILIKPNPDGSYPGEYGEFFPGLVPYDSTKIPIYNSFIDRCKNMRYNVRKNGQIVPTEIAMWRHVWHLRTKYFKRGAQSWYKWFMSLAAKDESGVELPYQQSLLARDHAFVKGAEDLRATVMEGSATVAYDKDTPGASGGEEGTGNGAPAGGANTGDIPFD